MPAQLLLTFGALIGLITPSFALGPAYVTTLEETPTRAAIGFFATTCPEAVRAECGYVAFICEGDKLALLIQGFANHELAEWLQDGLMATLSGAPQEELMPTAMFLSEMSGWSVRFEFADGATWLKSPAARQEISISEYHGTVPLSLGAKDQANFARFVNDCENIIPPKK